MFLYFLFRFVIVSLYSYYCYTLRDDRGRISRRLLKKAHEKAREKGSVNNKHIVPGNAML